MRELRSALETPSATLLGPAPLLRLRGRHRAQLLAKTEAPRAFATRAAAVLAKAAPAMRRDGLSAVVDVDPQSLERARPRKTRPFRPIVRAPVPEYTGTDVRRAERRRA
jgi:hypothetical protein